MQAKNTDKPEDWRSTGLRTLIAGTVYGVTSAVIGHPFDTIKTKMQAQSDYMTKKGTRHVITKVWKREGVAGFYRGMISTLFGAVGFRALGVAVYGTLQVFWSQDYFMNRQVPGLFGFQWRGLAGCALASALRTVIECPFENAKVKRQTARTWRFASLYRGISIIFARNITQMFLFIFGVETFKRHTSLNSTARGQFLIAGVASAASWLAVWPLETVKNMIQAEIINVGQTTRERVRWLLEHRGKKGLYRGMVPGLFGVFVRNGTAYVLMQRTVAALGRRGY